MILTLHSDLLVACTCFHGKCDNGPQGNGTCIPHSCLSGFHGSNCDQRDVPCLDGSVSRRCHVFASCVRLGNIDRYVLHGKVAFTRGILQRSQVFHGLIDFHPFHYYSFLFSNEFLSLFEYCFANLTTLLP